MEGAGAGFTSNLLKWVRFGYEWVKASAYGGLPRRKRSPGRSVVS